LTEQAEIYLEYGDIQNALGSLRKVRSYVSISNCPGILYLLKKAQFFAFSQEELLVVPAIYMQTFQST